MTGSGLLTDTSYNISASLEDTQDVVKKQWAAYQKWAPERAFEYLASLACAGLLFFTAAKLGGIRTDVLLLPQRFYEGEGETREQKQLVGNNSNDARNLRPAYVNFSVTDYLLFLLEEGTAPDGVLVGEAFTKAKAPEQLKKHVKTAGRKKTQIGALRLGIPFAYGANAKRGSDHDATASFLGDTYGDILANFVLKQVVHEHDLATSTVLANAYNGQVSDFTEVMPPLPPGSQASASPTVTLEVIDAELARGDDPMLDKIIASVKASLASIAGSNTSPILPALPSSDGDGAADDSPQKPTAKKEEAPPPSYTELFLRLLGTKIVADEKNPGLIKAVAGEINEPIMRLVRGTAKTRVRYPPYDGHSFTPS